MTPEKFCANLVNVVPMDACMFYADCPRPRCGGRVLVAKGCNGHFRVVCSKGCQPVAIIEAVGVTFAQAWGKLVFGNMPEDYREAYELETAFMECDRVPERN